MSKKKSPEKRDTKLVHGISTNRSELCQWGGPGKKTGQHSEGQIGAWGPGKGGRQGDERKSEK